MSIVLVHSTLYILSTIITIYVSVFFFILYISIIKLLFFLVVWLLDSVCLPVISIVIYT